VAVSDVAAWNADRLTATVSAGAGIASLLAGIGLYVVASWINVNYYDERPEYWGPWWLTALTFVIGLAVFGLGSLALKSGR
jgi:hypothetical protein